MDRSQSFSRNGIQLDVNLHSATKPKDRQSIQKVLNSRAASLLKTLKPKPRPTSQKKAPIANSISRSVPSSFQKCHTPVQNINAIYNQKIQLTKKRRHYYSMNKFDPPCYFDTVRDFYRKEHDEQERDACGKLLKTMNSENWVRSTQSLQNTTRFNTLTARSKLLIPFEKQTQRPFYQMLRKLQASTHRLPLTDEVDVKRGEIKKRDNMRKTHKFESYQKHDFLNPQKVAQFSSQMNIHKVNLKKFKQTAKSSHVKFDKFVNQIKTRYDRDSTPWLVKLNYDSKEEITRALREMRKFDKQSDRKMNEVHSKYPMRLAM